MKLKNGAVEFYEIKQDSFVHDYDENIPFNEYLYKEDLGDDFVDIRTFGADENADFLTNTKAINDAITNVSENGGGTVYVPKGEFICSTVRFKSNVRLFVEGTLRCITFQQNFDAEDKLYYGFIFGEDAENITLCGGGRISGNGVTFCDEPKSDKLLLPLETFHLKSYIMAFRGRIRFRKQPSYRVNLVEFQRCKNVDIHNIEMHETARWTCNIVECNGVDIKDVVINSNYHVANSDGFDITSSQNVVIDHCYIATGDDALCIKAHEGLDVDNVLIKNCKAMSLANCFKIGTNVYHNVRNVTIKDCEFFMDGTTGGYAGISIQSDRGSVVENITCENIKMDGITSAFVVWLGNRHQGTPGQLKNVTIKDITAENVSLPSAVTGTIFDGKAYETENVVINNVNIKYRDSKEEIYMREDGVGYEAMIEYPEITRLSSIYISSHEESPYWELPAYGLYLRHCGNIEIDNFRCVPRSVNTRPEIFKDKE